MTDTDKLKRLAEDYRIGGHFITVDRRTILALIAENERLRAEKQNMQAAFNDTVGECDKLSTERDEAVALLREIVDDPHCDVEGIKGACCAFLARIDAAE